MTERDKDFIMILNDLSRRFSKIPVSTSDSYRLATALFIRLRDKKTLAGYRLLEEVIEELEAR